MYVRPTLEGEEPTTFGVSGKLWRSALVMYDRQTLSLWSQIDGKVMAGPSTGNVLDELPSQLTTWADWRVRHPESLVLVKPPLDASPYRSYHEREFVGLPWFKNRDGRLPEKTLVIGVERGNSATALPVESLDRSGLVTFQLAEEHLLALAPSDASTRLVYLRSSYQGQPLDFVWATSESAQQLEDLATQSRWDWQTGQAISGALAGQRLEAVPVSPIYWGIWSRFYPQSEIVAPETPVSQSLD